MARSISCGVSLNEAGDQLSNFLRQLAHGHVLARVDVGEDLLDRLAHLGVGRLDRARVHSALEMRGHELLRVMADMTPAIT